MNFRVKEIAEKINGSFLCIVDGEIKECATAEELCSSLQDNCVVSSISVQDGKILLTISADKTVKNDMNADWVKEHKEKYGVEPNPFDGA